MLDELYEEDYNLEQQLKQCDNAVKCLMENGIDNVLTRAQRELLIEKLLEFDDVVKWLGYTLAVASPEKAKTMLDELKYWEAKGKI